MAAGVAGDAAAAVVVPAFRGAPAEAAAGANRQSAGHQLFAGAVLRPDVQVPAGGTTAEGRAPPAAAPDSEVIDFSLAPGQGIAIPHYTLPPCAPCDYWPSSSRSPGPCGSAG